MASRTIAEVSFLEMLPTNLRHVPEFQAAGELIEWFFERFDERLKQIPVYACIDDLDEPFLSMLAWQFHLDGEDGWALATSLDQKRALIKAAIVLHWRKGTRWAIEQLFAIIGLSGEIIEWWEAPAVDFPPFTFDVNIAQNGPADADLLDRIVRTIDSLKNVRSHRRHTRFVSGIKCEPPRVACRMREARVVRIGPARVLSSSTQIPCNAPQVSCLMRSAQVATFQSEETVSATLS